MEQIRSVTSNERPHLFQQLRINLRYNTLKEKHKIRHINLPTLSVDDTSIKLRQFVLRIFDEVGIDHVIIKLHTEAEVSKDGSNDNKLIIEVWNTGIIKRSLIYDLR